MWVRAWLPSGLQAMACPQHLLRDASTPSGTPPPPRPMAAHVVVDCQKRPSKRRPKAIRLASSSIPVADGQRVQQFKTMWDRKRKFCTVPVQQ